MGNAFGRLALTGSKRKRDEDGCAFVDGERKTQHNHQHVPLRSSDHHQRLEHGKECSTRVVKRNENKRRKNGRNSSSERDNCIIQNGGGTLDVGDRVAIKLSSRMDEEETFRNHIAPHQGSYGGELFCQLTPEHKEEVGLLIAYSGTNYPGLQINPGLRSIEAELEKALFLSGSILSSNFGCPRKICWSRSARTDKGVHAVGNLISAKLLIRPGTGGCDELRKEVNSHLPSDIRVLDVARLMRSFSAYACCERRKYYYLMPAACLLPAKEVDPLLRTSIHSSGEIDKNRLSCIAQDLSKYRSTKSQLELLGSILQQYEGTHSYHNFTKGKQSTDASAKRYVLSATVREPEIHQGQQWIPLEYIGASFMIHQIRKMTGLAILICRGSQRMDDLENAFKCGRQFVTTAPSTGLYLGKLYFEGYDSKVRRTAERQIQPKSQESQRVLKEQEAFRRDFIHSHIVREEAVGVGDVYFYLNTYSYLVDLLLSHRHTVEE